MVGHWAPYLADCTIHFHLRDKLWQSTTDLRIIGFFAMRTVAPVTFGYLGCASVCLRRAAIAAVTKAYSVL